MRVKHTAKTPAPPRPAPAEPSFEVVGKGRLTDQAVAALATLLLEAARKELAERTSAGPRTE